MKLSNKLILLTGASGGIGQVIARRLAKRGARLILVGRSAQRLNHLARELNLRAGGGFVFSADITTSAGLDIIRTALMALQEPLDGLINCAGVNAFSLLQDTETHEIERLIATNVTAPLLLTRLVLPFMNPVDGRIVNLGSSFGSLGYPGYSVYCASKFALRGFSEALRRELGDSPIQVAYLAPRATQTDLNSATVNAMNQALGNAVDAPEVVAAELEKMLTATHMHDRYIGWPERLFLWINSLLPGVIDLALRNQLPVIRRFAQAGSAKTLPATSTHSL